MFATSSLYDTAKYTVSSSYAAAKPRPMQVLRSGARVGGVALIPIHVYYGPGNPLHGKVCVVLGREVAGSYAGQWNFIGGSAKEHGGDAWSALCAEAEEELGLPLDASTLERCLISCMRIGSKEAGRGTLLVAAHITGLSSRRWSQMSQRRQGLGHKFNELYEIRHVPIEELYVCSGLSEYVRKWIPALYGMGGLKGDGGDFRKAQGVHYTEFLANATPIYRGLPMLK